MSKPSVTATPSEQATSMIRSLFRRDRMRLTRPDGGPYMDRWLSSARRAAGVWDWEIHRFLGSDRREPHCHPFWFVALTLKGRAVEHRYRPGPSLSDPPVEVARAKLHRLRFYRATDMHRIAIAPGSGPVWTLTVHGRRRRQWGFWTDRGFVPYDSAAEETSGRANWVSPEVRS